MKIAKIFFSATIALASFSVYASGGGGYGGGGGFGGGTGTSFQRPQVDQTFEIGKAIFKGRQSGVPQITYCVASDDGVKLPVKSKSIRPFKKTSYQNLSDNLYNCDVPDTLVSDELSRDNLLYVLYYLNKRYKLSLSGR